MVKFYKLRRNKSISGVLAGLADKFDFDLGLIRFLFVLFTVFNFGLGIIIYIILANVMPYKEDVEAERYGTGPRKRKNAEPVQEDDWFW
ncbi:PspC domain-containing protein [Streptococcus himalayensis]|uniref:Phage-shock protein n=1 Tax=Streptococcus himalayensis TaxID=1888195 RepID=A0A917EG98_9STRE|nr:PspC domain-containing protein [Streptococcus himalayensis]GGE30359.1 phage-shock protein [Streptococcus himalayensis]